VNLVQAIRKEKIMTYEMLAANNACALLVDNQSGLMLFTGDIDPVHLISASVFLIKQW